MAAGLLARDVMPGDTVAIMLPTSRAYFVTFAGVVLAGAVPVPIYPPARPSQLADHLRRHTGILANARAALLVTVPEAIPLGHLLRANVDSLRHVVVPESLTGATRWRAFLDAGPTTSRWCSTPRAAPASPKGVALTHDNLLANIRAMGAGRGGVGGGHVRQLAAAVSRHGSDRRVARVPVFRHTAGGDAPPGVLDPPVAMAAGDPHQPRHDLGRPELRLRTVPRQDR